jgi:signal transduction histidine kinase
MEVRMPAQEVTSPVRRWSLRARARLTLDSLEHLVGGLGTAVLSLVALSAVLVSAILCLAGVGLVLAPVALRVVRAVTDRERARLSRWGREIVSPEPVPDRLADAVRDPAIRAELGWLAWHATFGLLLGAIGLSLPLYAIRDGAYPLYHQLIPADNDTSSMGLWPSHTLVGSLGVSAISLLWITLSLGLIPGMARLQARIGYRLLSPAPGSDLALRVAQLTATRAAALDAHATELRRIERSLHDGTQNRLVAVNVLLGAARRALARDSADTDALLGRAQDATEQALADLRAVVRSILPPVLADRSLPDALTGLAANCPVTCRIDAQVPDRFPVSVEATAYFVVAEALTNIARHSGARHATVTLRRRDERLWVQIADDGDGGADERSGSGLAGIRRRVEAHDGTFMLASPAGGPTEMTVSLPCGL